MIVCDIVEVWIGGQKTPKKVSKNKARVDTDLVSTTARVFEDVWLFFFQLSDFFLHLIFDSLLTRVELGLEMKLLWINI